MDTSQQINTRLASIENKLDKSTDQYAEIKATIDNKLTAPKEVLTFDEVAALTGLSKSYLYKLTSARQIPHYKPNGRLIYFNREEVLNWMQRGKVATSEELEQQAATYSLTNKKGGRNV